MIKLILFIILIAVIWIPTIIVTHISKDEYDIIPSAIVLSMISSVFYAMICLL